MTLQQAYEQLLLQLHTIYDQKEAANIANLVFEHITGQRKIDRVLNKATSLGEAQIETLATFTGKLLQHMPVQYVLHEAWFAGMKFYVDEKVLIPRPETEELVEWIISDSRFTNYPALPAGRYSPFTILDIGTGSGCIAIALKKKLPAARLTALDSSEAALSIAKRNALLHKTDIHFFKADILANSATEEFELFDLIVSNPPYVKRREAGVMPSNVFLYEPHEALFVPDEDPLLFYRHICDFAFRHLKANGKIFFEINETFGPQVQNLLRSNGFIEVEIRKDMQSKDRMVRAVCLARP